MIVSSFKECLSRAAPSINLFQIFAKRHTIFKLSIREFICSYSYDTAWCGSVAPRWAFECQPALSPLRDQIAKNSVVVSGARPSAQHDKMPEMAKQIIAMFNGFTWIAMFKWIYML